MTSDEVREGLREMRITHSVGTILGLLAECVEDEADAEFVAGDFESEDQSRIVLGTLYSVSMGVDVIRYRPGEGA